MGLDIKTLAAARKYTSETVEGCGAVVGKNVTISSITPIDGGNRITFSYTLDSGTAKTSTLDVMNGINGDVGQPGKDGLDGKSIIDATVDDSNQLILTLSDNTTINAGIITTLKGDIGLAGRDGTTPQFTIGTVTTIDSDQEASASITGTSANPVLNLFIPKGESGSDINSSDEKVKLTFSSTDAHYLEDLIDNSTIEIDTENNSLIVKKIDGQTATIAEINFLSGVTSNIQEQINNLGKSMSMYGVFDTKKDLIASTEPVPLDGNTAIVVADESNNFKQMTYIYIASTAAWTQVAESTVSIRDFTANPIDLSTETTGILPKEKIDAAIARLANVLDKTTYKGSADGVVKSADTLNNLHYTIAELNDAVDHNHTHANKIVLDKIVSNGIGNRLLADNGTYKEILVLSSTQPTDEYCIWLDNTDNTKIVLKIFDGTDWIPVSGASSGNNSGTPIIVDNVMSDISTNPVQNKVIKEYVDNKSVDVSTQDGNAIQKTSDGLFVEDKTDAIDIVNDKLESIDKYHKYVNTDLDYCLCLLDTTYSNTALSTGQTMPFILKESNMQYNSDNHSVILKSGKTYKISVDCQINFTSTTTTSQAVLSIYNLTTDTELLCFNKALASVSSAGCNAEYIYSPNSNEEICIRVYRCEGVSKITNKSDQFSYFIVEEVGRQLSIDPLEYVNTSNGIEDTPVGHIIAHTGITAPAHYLICDGSEYNITDYPYLAQHIIDNFGSTNYFGGDGTTTFAVPDLRGEFLRGTGTNSHEGQGNGSNIGVHQDATTIPYYNVTASQLQLRRDDGETDGNNGITKLDSAPTLVGNNTLLTANLSSGITTMDYSRGTVRPTNTSVLYCIKYEPTYYMKVEGKDVYSTTEKMIGYWIDGKPIYQKTFIGHKLPVTTDGTVKDNKVDVSDLSINLCVSLEGLFYNSNATSFFPMSYGATVNSARLWYDRINECACISNSAAGYGDRDVIFTIRYTKRTD